MLDRRNPEGKSAQGSPSTELEISTCPELVGARGVGPGCYSRYRAAAFRSPERWDGPGVLGSAPSHPAADYPCRGNAAGAPTSALPREPGSAAGVMPACSVRWGSSEAGPGGHTQDGWGWGEARQSSASGSASPGTHTHTQGSRFMGLSPAGVTRNTRS